MTEIEKIGPISALLLFRVTRFGLTRLERVSGWVGAGWAKELACMFFLGLAVFLCKQTFSHFWKKKILERPKLSNDISAHKKKSNNIST